MTTLNTYATLAEYKAQALPDAATDAADDTVIESLLKQASRYIDSGTGRYFYPEIKTLYFDVPSADSVDPRLLKVDQDLLEIITLTNGDGTVIPSTEYKLQPKNSTPYSGIRLVDNSPYYWATNGSGDSHDVITVYGVWGFHDRYSRAWLTGSTLAEDLDTSETGIDVTSGTLFAIGNITRIENELQYISNVATNTLTGTRGENESTAATHVSTTAVKIWQVVDECKSACLEIVNNAYRRRFGSASGESSATVTASGIVLHPKEIPQMARAFIEKYRRYL